MNKVLLVVIIQILFFSFLFSQTEPDSLWFNTYGGENFDSAFSVTQTSDANYVFVGSTDSFGNGYSDIYLVKTDENGNELWSKTFGGIDHDGAGSVAETTDSGLILFGGTNSFGVEQSALYLIKTDSNGDSLWTQVINLPDYDYARFNYGIQISDGGYVIVGNGIPETSTADDIFLLKTDENGNLLWTRNIGGSINDSWDLGKCVQQTNDNGFIIAGSTGAPDQSPGNVYLIKTNALGNTLWTKQFNGNGNSHGNYIQQTNDSGFIITGYVEYYGVTSDIYLIRTNGIGDTLWTSKIGGQSDCMGFCVKQTTDEGFVVAGSIHDWCSDETYKAYILKTNSYGDSMWSQSYGCDLAVANSIITTDEDEYIIAGNTNSYSSPLQTDAFLLKLGYETSTDEVINNSHFSAVNYPNPFNPTTTIEFSIQNDSEVKLIIFNIKGQIIKSLINEYLNIGKHSVNWDGCDNSGQSVGSGVYLYQIKTPTETITKRMLLLK